MLRPFSGTRQKAGGRSFLASDGTEARVPRWDLPGDVCRDSGHTGLALGMLWGHSQVPQCPRGSALSACSCTEWVSGQPMAAGRGLGAGVCGAHSGDTASRAATRVAQSFALSCSSSKFSFWHVHFPASCLYVCGCVWGCGERRKTYRRVAPGRTILRGERPTAALSSRELSGPGSRGPSWGR